MDYDLLYNIYKRVKAGGYQTRWNTFKPRVSQIRGELIETANSRDRVTYETLGDRIDTDHRKHLGIYLRGLTYYNYERDEPPLAVLVVNAGTRRPASGFYNQAEEMGIIDLAVETEDSAFGRLRQEVYGFF